MDDLLLLHVALNRLSRILVSILEFCRKLLVAQLMLLQLLVVFVDQHSLFFVLLRHRLSSCSGFGSFRLGIIDVATVVIKLVSQVIALKLQHVVGLNQALSFFQLEILVRIKASFF